MSQMSYFFGHILKYFYGITNDYVLSIILFTIVTKMILLPLTFSQMRSMNAMKRIQPKVNEINKKYKKNPQKQNQMLSKLYKENKVNPAAGCLPLLVQFPIIIAMFRVIRQPVKYVFDTQAAYELADKGFYWVSSIKDPDTIMLYGVSLPYILPMLSALFTYLQMQMSMSNQSQQSDNKIANSMNNSMKYTMPLMMLYMGSTFPAGLVLYWTVSTLFQIVQQYLIGKFEYHMDFYGNKSDK